MRFSLPLAALGIATVVAAAELEVKTTFMPTNCPIKTQKGDKLSMHYTGTLAADGSKFDSSVLIRTFHTLNSMCVTEKRTLTIPAHMGYGDRGYPPVIPGGATLVFDVELLGIKNREAKKEEL
ncbi:Peptidyl-prolyl cis-trans isomerase fpr2 [Tulasnella sp. 330]|nr:Peptidyl-prolyl cis-trans isomerase fpr2 [Tulasnella sp. 330]